MPPSKSSVPSAAAATVAPSESITASEHPDYVDGSVGSSASAHGPAGEDGAGIAAADATTSANDWQTQPPSLGTARCAVVSGRYLYKPPGSKTLYFRVRVDVDRYFPQRRISVEVGRLDSRRTAHVVAEVISDRCLAPNERRISAVVVYRDGESQLLPGDKITFEASPGTSVGYQNYAVTMSVAGAPVRRYPLAFESPYFEEVEFEVARVEDAGEAVTTYDTASHPIRPADLPNETLSLATVYQRAGFDVKMSPHGSVIPISAAGVNGTWSVNEMHDAMVAYWSRFADRPQWAVWVLYAARHDLGRYVGGLMFDDIGPNHRQGTAIFTDALAHDPPAGDPQAAAWTRRMMFWTAVHEIGHTFNLAHSWQKSLGVAQGTPGDPWIPLVDQPEARSFLNYPFLVSGGPPAFFSDFRFRFIDDELIFMRHAPRRFVQMGNANWFVNHGFEAPELFEDRHDWRLDIRPNRASNAYRFLEPVTMEFKLTNLSPHAASLPTGLLDDGHHLIVFVQRDGGLTRQWRPMITRCQIEDATAVPSGDAIYAAHLISASSAGWMIDEPGFYTIQAAVDVGPRTVVSNVLRLYVAPSHSVEEDRLAPDYFTEEVGRALVFGATPSLSRAADVLREVVAREPAHAAAAHAAQALARPRLRDQKRLQAAADGSGLEIGCEKADTQAAFAHATTLLAEPDAAADTLGHIPYFDTLQDLSSALSEAGEEGRAKDVMRTAVATMKKRKVLPSVVEETERKLESLE